MNEITTASMLTNQGAMEALYRFAEAMASSTVTVPDHLRGKVGDCMAVAMQAAQWGMNPFAVAQKTHVVSGRLGYEAQLVIAVVQAGGAIRGSFRYEFQGDGAAVACRVGAVLAGEQEVTWGEWLRAADVTTKNSPLWKVNPKQQLGYLQAKNWSRLYCPGAILGVYTPDELEQIAPPAAPPAPRHMGDLKPVQAELTALPAPDADLRAAAEEAALLGVDGFRAFFKGATKEQRAVLRPLIGEFEMAAKEADAARQRAAESNAAAWADPETGEVQP
jgi:hypothetical protein